MTVTVAKFAANAVRAPLSFAAVLGAAILGAATLATALAGPASAQSASPMTDTWIKVCRSDDKQKKELCKTAYDLRTAGGQFLASVAIVEATGEARKIVEMIMPTGLLLQPGLKVQVDQNKGEDAKFGMCAPDGCVAQMVSNEAFVSAMKKGGQLSITAYGQTSNEVTFTVPLASFKAANEGKPLDEAALKKREEAIAGEIQEKQKSIEEQLREEQRKASQGKP
ncbi:MAG: invasion associated locus B family protein [Hyphomicrobiales bacterium]|nr:invasion associated locus B family protein [Hyphomicrobiales bacterium]